MTVHRGEVYWINFNPVQGSEEAGRRPAVVIQNDIGNQFSPCTVVAIISSRLPTRPYPFIVCLAAGEAGLPNPSAVNCSQLRTVDKGRLESFAGTLTPGRMREINAALRMQLDLEG